MTAVCRRVFRSLGRGSGRSALAVAVAVGVAGTGCSSSTKPGNLSAVRIDSEAPRAGNVYLLRGWIGIFSEGIDRLGDELNTAGVRAHVYQEDQWRPLAEQIERRYAGKPDHEPVVLIGHSYGADSVVRIAQLLREKNIEVDLLVTLDPVTPPRVPSNVLRTYNLYQSNGLLDTFPWLRGIPLEPSPDNANPLANYDIRKDRTDLLAKGLDHFNIEKQPQVHADVIQRVLEICPPRPAWVSARASLAQARILRSATRSNAVADLSPTSSTRPTSGPKGRAAP